MKARSLRKIILRLQRRGAKDESAKLRDEYSRQWAGTHKGRLRTFRMVERAARELVT